MASKIPQQGSDLTPRIIALGDIHGRALWKEIVNRQTFDKLVIIGDYFDTKENVSPEIQIENFKAICEYKRTNKENVVLLIGNHDYHYLDITIEQYTGFQQEYHEVISSLLHASLDDALLQMSYLYEKILFTHAGVTKTWCNENEIDIADIEISINHLFSHHPERFAYYPSGMFKNNPRTPGISPIWVRPENLLPDKIDHFIQVVGHTQQPRIRFEDDIIFIDTLGTLKEFLMIKDGNFYTENINSLT